MLRTRTTFVVGAGAGCELQLPGGGELLNRIGQGYDFSRVGTPLQTRDNTLILETFAAIAADDEEITYHALCAAADRIRIAARMGRSIDDILEQHQGDRLVTLAGRLAIVHFMAQAEAKSLLRPEPRIAGELPIQGSDTWIYQLGQTVTAGVPRRLAERCLDNFAIVSFCYDRSVEHLLPHVLMMAFGMPLAEAQALVAQRLCIVHPHGVIGRLPWQGGEDPVSEWATEAPRNLPVIAGLIRTPGEAATDEAMRRAIAAALGESERLVFLGFGFHPANFDLLCAAPLDHRPEVMATVHEQTAGAREAVRRMLARMAGDAGGDRLALHPVKAGELLRDNALLLES